jgi:GNAT superfamily N-acetyltransferase
MSNPFYTRLAKQADVPVIMNFIRELAEYEKLAHEVVADEAQIQKTLFGEKAYAEVLMAIEEAMPVGFALFFHNYSTFLGKPGIYLEDLYITPAARGKGYGKCLMQKLAQLALERDCGRLEWWVLDWNKASIDFYTSMGALPMDEWTVYRVTGPALSQLAEHNTVALAAKDVKHCTGGREPQCSTLESNHC